MSDLLHCICPRSPHPGPPGGCANLWAFATAPCHQGQRLEWMGEEARRFPDRTASIVSFPGRWR